jgi:hypothetical protein
MKDEANGRVKERTDGKKGRKKWKRERKNYTTFPILCDSRYWWNIIDYAQDTQVATRDTQKLGHFGQP